ncbi:prepilin-type N-terminal cleavage/methylation domain-containing protein [Bdellovibrio sp. BCCA]|uniref:prepilin-type N-terminal cleavage/methylation domain-containing protein n=1 Tax=Bdellovibrio sp. BCCA TaxID=3136281 RepID=UPI0030F105B7
MYQNKNGFTLVEILVSLAILATVSIGVGAIIQVVFKRQANIVNKTESNEFMNSLGKWLQSAAGCSAALMNLPAPTASETPLTINGYNGYGGNNLPIADNFRINNQLLIKNVTIKDKGAAPSTLQIGTNIYTRKVAQIKIGFEEQTAGTNVEMRTRFIEVPILIGPTNTIAQCHIETSLADACTAMGGTYVASSNTCKPATNCQMKGTYIVLTCSPSDSGCDPSFSGDYRNPITNTTSCPSGATPSILGRFIHTHEVSCGKKCTTTITNQEDFYICMQCS